MKGSNKIELNQATMQEAVQHYFQTVIFREGVCPVVDGVDVADRQMGTFTVKLKEAEPEIRRDPYDASLSKVSI